MRRCDVFPKFGRLHSFVDSLVERPPIKKGCPRDATVCSDRQPSFLFLFRVAADVLFFNHVAADEVDLWIDTTTPQGGPSKGIYHTRFDTDEGKMTEPRLAAEIASPGFLTLHPDGEVL